MTVAMMKALHFPIPLIVDALFASFLPTIFPMPPLPPLHKTGFKRVQCLTNTTLNKYLTLTYKLVTQLVHTYPSGH